MPERWLVEQGVGREWEKKRADWGSGSGSWGEVGTTLKDQRLGHGMYEVPVWSATLRDMQWVPAFALTLGMGNFKCLYLTGY